jgi:hypothetical protein
LTDSVSLFNYIIQKILINDINPYKFIADNADNLDAGTDEGLFNLLDYYIDLSLGLIKFNI